VIRKSVVPLESRPDFAALWQERQASMNCTFFTSAAWIRAWAGLIPERSRAWLFELDDDRGTQSLAILVQSRDWIARLLPMRRLWLHATGCRPLDDLTIEFNGIPSTEAYRAHAESSLLAALNGANARWDQFMVPHAAHAGRWMAAAESLGLNVKTTTHPCYHVDLAAIRACGGQYANRLSKKTRYLLRRSRNEIEHRFGPISVEVAETIDEAADYFGRMLQLHEQYWRGRGQGGAFDHPTILAFHNALLRSTGGLQVCRMLRVRAGTNELGYLYLFVWRGVAYFYQSGINYEGVGRARSPGYVTIAAALEHLLATDVERFEFLAGENLYKSRLATGSSQLHSLEIQRPNARNAFLNLCRLIKCALRSIGRQSPDSKLGAVARAGRHFDPSAIAAMASMVFC